MKKFIFALMTVFALGMASCSHNKTASDAGTADSTVTVVDSVLVDTVATDSVVVL